MERVLLDTNVLCGAILGNGVNVKLLQLARGQTVFQPVISEVVIMEFLTKCRRGLTKKKIVIPEDIIDRFFYVLTPMLDDENILTALFLTGCIVTYPVGRSPSTGRNSSQMTMVL